MTEKSVLISEEIHKELKTYSLKSGIKIKMLVEMSIKNLLKKIKFDGGDE